MFLWRLPCVYYTNLDISDYSSFVKAMYNSTQCWRLQNLDKRWEEVLTFVAPLSSYHSFLHVIEQKWSWYVHRRCQERQLSHLLSTSKICYCNFQDFSGFFGIFQDFSGFFRIFQDFSGFCLLGGHYYWATEEMDKSCNIRFGPLSH